MSGALRLVVNNGAPRRLESIRVSADVRAMVAKLEAMPSSFRRAIVDLVDLKSRQEEPGKAPRRGGA